jgi:hypothetical protein
MRLVFEQGLFAYKFMALAVMLIVLDVVNGRIRGSLVAWLVLASVGYRLIPIGLDFNAKPWGGNAVAVLQIATIAIFLFLIVRPVLRRQLPPWYLIAVCLIATAAFMQWPPWTIDSLRSPLPKWVWQVLLVPAGVMLAIGPLIRFGRRIEPGGGTGAEEVAVVGMARTRPELA